MIPTMSDEDFIRLSQYIKAQYGINLTQKRQLVTSRLASLLSEKGYSSYTPLVSDLLDKKDSANLELVLNRLTTNYTFFMREQEHYHFFEKTALPELTRRHQRDRVLAIWSAGCSTGEEPYNISMYIKDFLGTQADRWDARVLATDISQRALAAAKRGVYDLPDTIPEHWRKRYFVQEKGSEQYAVAPVIRDNVIFQTFNLMDPIRFRLKFDVIFCRNVMIYFDQPTKEALIRRFYDATAPGGYLMIGHSESLDKNSLYRAVASSTFQKR
jgi:chemotaxis protein methyltransferase CheR